MIRWPPHLPAGAVVTCAEQPGSPGRPATQVMTAPGRGVA